MQSLFFRAAQPSLLQSVSFQRIIGLIILILGISYGIWILIRAIKTREQVKEEKGKLPILMGLEAVAFFIATLGISDYLQNTLIIRTGHLTDDKKLPGSLAACGLVPGAVIAFSLLHVENPVEVWTVIPCIIAVVIGSNVGTFIVRHLDGAKIKNFMKFALIASLAALIVRMIISRGTAGEATGLNIWQMIPAILLSFAWGVVGMIGIPMKPAGTALFLLLGMSPLSTLTMVLVIGCMAPLGGGMQVIRSGLYHQKMALSSVIGGTIGAILGCLFAISVSATLLNILLLIVMVVAIVSMFRK